MRFAIGFDLELILTLKIAEIAARRTSSPSSGET